MNVQDYQRLGARLEELLRLRTHMVAIKWLEKEADIPADAIVPTRDLKKHMALCQAFTYARMKSKTIAMTKREKAIRMARSEGYPLRVDVQEL